MEHWLEREIAQWVHPMKNRSDDPLHHERMLLPRSYISLHSLSPREVYESSLLLATDFQTISSDMVYLQHNNIIEGNVRHTSVDIADHRSIENFCPNFQQTKYSVSSVIYQKEKTCLKVLVINHNYIQK